MRGRWVNFATIVSLSTNRVGAFFGGVDDAKLEFSLVLAVQVKRICPFQTVAF
jgi:hypothetical protein